MNKQTWKCIFDVFTFVVVFIAIQIVVQMAVSLVSIAMSHTPIDNLQAALVQGLSGSSIVIASLIEALIVLFLFTKTKWAPVSRNYLNSRPWVVLLWVVTLAIGTILPLQWVYEKMQLTMPEAYEELFESIMREPLGYFAIGILAPLTEELVFRGAILRVLLKHMGERWHWGAIAISALLFAVVHGNVAQDTHALLIGLLLGWLYYRSGSIVPGVVLHWVNNTVAYAMFVFMPQMGDGKLIDFFHGNNRAMYLGLACSLCVFLPSLFQLTLRLRHPKA